MNSSSTSGRLGSVADRIGPLAFLLVAALILLLPGFTSLPPMDRDEPRFAQASKQMLETSDFVDIRFGNEARNKKPVGIYWMQAAAVGAAELMHVPDARRRIWLYRLPSLVGALATVLITYWAGLAFMPRRSAALAALLLSATLLVGVEARLATTDSVVTASVAAAMGALARAYMNRALGKHCSLGVAALFWTAIGVGILVKGPITPMVPLLAAVALSIRSGSARWLMALRPVPGLIWCLAVVLPWFSLILLRTHGAFLTEAVGHDMMGKVAGGQEMHGLPPGSYFATFWFAGWPLAPFVALAAPAIWRQRREDSTAFLLAWLVPAWLVFEIVPTKLFHYVLPLYPALAILAVAGLERAAAQGKAPGKPRAWLLFALLAIVPVAVLTLVFVLNGRFWTLDATTSVGALLATAAALFLAWQAQRSLASHSLRRAVAFAAAAALPVYLFVFARLLTPAIADQIALSSRLAGAAATALGRTCPQPLYATVGDREPSLMFLTDTSLLMTDGGGAAQFIADGPCRVAFVEARDEAAFSAALDPGAPVRQATRIRGIELNGGGALDIGVYVRQ